MTTRTLARVAGTALAIALTAHGAASAALDRAQQQCIVGVNEAGAGVADAAGVDVVRCLREKSRSRLPVGQTCAQCVVADNRGAVARAETRTTAIAARRCAVPPAFGPIDPAAVNAAFARLLRLDAVFGVDLDAAVRSARTDRAGAACQAAVVRGVVRIAGARLREFDACKAAGLKAGTIASAADLRACLDADPRARVTHTIALAQLAAARRCARTPVAVAFPGACAGEQLANLLGCLARRVRCDVCAALEGADGLGEVCHRVVDGVASGSCDLQPALAQSVARQWDEELLGAIRLDTPRPTVHARNLFHTAVAMYDAWAAYDTTAAPYLVDESPASSDVEADRATAISFAAYRVLSARFAASPGASRSLPSFAARMLALGYDTAFTSMEGGSAAAVGNRIGAAVLAYGATDGANEAGNYADPSYMPVNAPLIVKLPGTTMVDPNRWQPLALDVMIGQNGVPIPGKIQSYIGARWGGVKPFALTRTDPNDVYLDPGPPPQLGGAGDAAFKAMLATVVRYSSRLDPADPTTIDLSPGAFGNNPLGTNDGTGHPMNPVTGSPYAPNVVKRGDFARVLAEFWADGPSSETPPGHWNVIANYVSDQPSTVKRIGGTGPVLSALEWDVKLYLALNGAVHDAAIVAWGLKRKYDSVRPISGIRYAGGKGQSSDSSGPAYDPGGLPLEPGVIEVITAASTAAGERHEQLAGHEGEIAVRAWPGEPADPATQVSGARWVRAVEWVPYQRKTFVTPAFPAFISGHSTFSRSAAEVLVRFTGSPSFPGGLGEFVAAPDTFLTFEHGPSGRVALQWGTYYDAADQAGLSRLYGGIHIAADDFAGRILGAQIGPAAFDLAVHYFDGRGGP
jgi:hypothetical protein